MPYYPNGSLKTLMSTRHLTVREIVIFATQFLSGLHHIHSQKLVHFDIKPDNILLSERGEALVADFGLAKARGINGLVDQDMHYGKMAPPEAFQNGAFDHRYDIYQVGLTLFRMCVGDAEFYSQYNSHRINGDLDRMSFKHAVVNGQFPDTRTGVFPEHIPDALIKVVKRCLQTVDQRYPSAIEVVNDLASIDGPTLDWLFVEDAQGKRWSKQVEDMNYSLSLTPTGSSVAKKWRNGGQGRRIGDYCVEALSRQATKRFLRDN